MLNVILIKNYSEPPRCEYDTLKVIYHPLYSMNNFVANKSKLPQDGTQVFPYIGDWLSCEPLRGSHDSQSPHIRT